MSTDHASVLDFALELAAISLLSIGGVQAILPEIQRKLVEVNGWMSASTFADLYALGTAAPGPNAVVGTLLGFHLGGLWGAFLFTCAMTLPTSLFAYFMAQVWERFRAASWRQVIADALAPITVGLMLAAGYLLTQAADHDWKQYGLSALAVLLLLRTRINPVWMILAGALLGLTGWV
jgi:chromate transporter